jgi:hypothetical protein
MTFVTVTAICSPLSMPDRVIADPIRAVAWPCAAAAWPEVPVLEVPVPEVPVPEVLTEWPPFAATLITMTATTIPPRPPRTFRTV